METSVMIREADLKEQIAYMKSILNERQYRCYLGTTAISLGRGGQALVARLSGSSINTVRKGMEEVRNYAEIIDTFHLPKHASIL